MGDTEFDKELRQAKANLYRLLLTKSHDDYSEQEIEITFNLARDSDIQKILREKMAQSNPKPLGEDTNKQ